MSVLHAGLVGTGIGHSLSPSIHEAEAAALGIPLRYELYDIPKTETDQLYEFILAGRRGGYVGLNVTFPFKQTIIPMLDGLSEEAHKLGAVNTITFVDGRAVGHNTDWWGFYTSLSSNLPDVDLTELIQLGAGGAGAAVSFALLRRGCSYLTLVDPNTSRASELAQKFVPLFPAATIVAAACVDTARPGVTGVVQTSQIGMRGHPGTPLPADYLRPWMWVADIIYEPAETELLASARRLGCNVLNGADMLMRQAAKSFELFTGREPDLYRMRRRFGST